MQLNNEIVIHNKSIGNKVITFLTFEHIFYIYFEDNSIQLFQLRLSPSKAEKWNTSAKSLLGVTIKNTQTEQNLVSRDA